MRIQNDVITFDAADFAGLSADAQAALSVQFDGAPPEQYFSDRFNNTLDAAKQRVKEKKIASLQDFVEAVVSASDSAKAQLQPIFDQAAAVLGLSEVKVPGATVDPESPAVPGVIAISP